MLNVHRLVVVAVFLQCLCARKNWANASENSPPDLGADSFVSECSDYGNREDTYWYVKSVNFHFQFVSLFVFAARVLWFDCRLITCRSSLHAKGFAAHYLQVNVIFAAFTLYCDCPHFGIELTR